MALAEEIDTYLDRLHLSGMLNKEQTVCASMMQVILHALQRIFIECEKTRVRLAAAYKSKHKFSPNDLSEIDRGLALAEKIITRSMASVIKGVSWSCLLRCTRSVLQRQPYHDRPQRITIS